jgi:hypothetical protein
VFSVGKCAQPRKVAYPMLAVNQSWVMYVFVTRLWIDELFLGLSRSLAAMEEASLSG